VFRDSGDVCLRLQDGGAREIAREPEYLDVAMLSDNDWEAAFFDELAQLRVRVAYQRAGGVLDGMT
jgi:hypothetical protein